MKKVNLNTIYNEMYLKNDIDYAVCEEFYTSLASRTDADNCIDLDNKKTIKLIEDFLDAHRNDYQFVKISFVLEPILGKNFPLLKKPTEYVYGYFCSDGSKVNLGTTATDKGNAIRMARRLNTKAYVKRSVSEYYALDEEDANHG